MLIKPQNCQICLQFAKMEKIGKFGPTGTEYHFADEIQIQRNAYKKNEANNLKKSSIKLITLWLKMKKISKIFRK